VNLADAYRRQGNLEGALRVCMRGLERRPDHAGAHALLARLYLEKGEREKAFDEWGVVLRLDPAHFEANRGMGFVRLERGDLLGARGYLERAAARRPGDALTREALELVERKAAAAAPPLLGHQAAEGDTAARAGEAAPDRATRGTHPGRAGEPAPVASPPPARPGHEAAAGPSRSSPRGVPRDPARLFESLGGGDGPFGGALLVDGAGFVIGGDLGPGAAQAEAVGAALGGAAAEAERAAALLGLGDWSGVLLHTDEAAAHLGPVDGGHTVMLAASANAPTGWVLHTADTAADIARAFLGGQRD
jgi:tetratricopeptide (TPR) repeat protein